MKHLLLSIILISFINTIAQTEREKKEIINKTNVKSLTLLQERIRAENIIKQKNIETFLYNNNSFKKSYKKDGASYLMIDVIDGKPIYITNNNTGAAFSSRTNSLQVGGSLNLDLEGENITAGVWDGGSVLDTHQEFNNNGTSRVTKMNPVSSDDHATHVAGTIAANGTNANALGMASKSNITSYDWTSDTVEMITEITNNGLILSNHSYGVYANTAPSWMMGCYNDSARDWDQILHNAEYYLSVLSAGNDGNTVYSGGLLDGYDKLTGNKNSKNSLVVANANPFLNSSTGALINLTINSSSSEGPTDDGRVKPDITADGTDTFSPVDTSNQAYATYTGTSMASPSVTGTLVLLQEYYNQLNNEFMKSATAKGILIHTAEKGFLLPKGPSPVFGFGLVNAKNAAELILDDSNNISLIDEKTLTNGNTYIYNFTTTGSDPIIATICWTDPAGTSHNGQLNSPARVLVNDLDIRINDGTTTFFPWKLDLNDIDGNAIKGDNIVDNVEKIEIDTPTAGSYTLTVTHKGSLTNSSQNFSLFLSGESVVLSNHDNQITTFKAYPNPVKDIFTIEGIDTITNVTIFNLLGQKVMETTPNETTTKLDMTKLYSGTYFVKVTINNTTETMKIVK